MPNLYLVTQPVKVVRASGTIVSAYVSLGYDVSQVQIEHQLLAAADATGLADPFVRVTEIGDYSVTYRIAGFLEKVKFLLSVRSKLRANMLDFLHDAGIEFVSPMFMNQRRPPMSQRYLPSEPHPPPPEVDKDAPLPEEIIFDKAERAGSREQLKGMLQEINEETDTPKSELDKASDDDSRNRITKELDAIGKQRATVETALEDTDDDEKRNQEADAVSEMVYE